MLGFEVSGDIAVLTLAESSRSTAWASSCGARIVEALERAEDSPSVRAVVIIGSGKGFSGGADIREFGTPKALAAPHLLSVLRTVEDCAKPVVAAIGGICMGGGFELALACHYRVAAADAQLGLPEVKLGLLPGAGGTQRLPRAIGVERALNMIVSGKPVRAEELRDTALLDAVVAADQDLRAAAVEFARALVAGGRGPKRLRDLPLSLPKPRPTCSSPARGDGSGRAVSGPAGVRGGGAGSGQGAVRGGHEA